MKTESVWGFLLRESVPIQIFFHSRIIPCASPIALELSVDI